MTTRLEEQLSRYGRFFEATLDELTPEASMVPGIGRAARSSHTAWWRRGWAVAVAAAAAVLVLVGGVALLLTRSDPGVDMITPTPLDPPTTAVPITTTPPTSVPATPEANAGMEPELDDAAAVSRAFDFSEDSLCDWFTGEDLDEIVAAAQRRAGTDLDFATFAEGSCHEETQAWYSGLAEIRLSPWPGRQVVREADFAGHEFLDETVTYGSLELARAYSLRGIRANLRLAGHPQVLRFLVVADPGLSSYSLSQYAALGFAVADAMLRDMDWID